MRIVADTPELLVIDHRPWRVGIGLILFILAFTGVGLAMLLAGEGGGWWPLGVGLVLGIGSFLVLVRRIQLVLDRGHGEGRLHDRNVFRTEHLRFALIGIERVLVEEEPSRDGTTRRVALVVGGTAHPLTPYFSAHPSHREVADAINDWLSAARTA
jgi:hypothetical protein